MMKKLLLLLAIIITSAVAKSQTLNWHLSAQAGTANYQFENFEGSFLAGFKSEAGQELSVGPVVKGYYMDNHSNNMLGARIYSQAKLFNSFSVYMQCDVFGGVPSQTLSSTRSPMRLETGAGLNFTFQEKFGVSAGCNIGALDPISNVRKNTPSVKLIYLMPFAKRGW